MTSVYRPSPEARILPLPSRPSSEAFTKSRMPPFSSLAPKSVAARLQSLFDPVHLGKLWGQRASWRTGGHAMPRVRADYQLRLKGIWILLAFYLIAISAVSRSSPFCVLVGDLLGVPRDADTATDYLEGYVATGVSATAALLVILVLASFTWRRDPRWTLISTLGAWTLLTSQIVYALAILWRSFKVLDQKNGDSILADRHLLPWASDVGLWSGVAIMAFLWLGGCFLSRFKKKRLGSADGGSPGISAS